MEKVQFNLNVFKDEQGCFWVVVVMSVGEEGYVCVECFVDVGVDMVVVDIVYGYFQKVLNMVSRVKKFFNLV